MPLKSDIAIGILAGCAAWLSYCFIVWAYREFLQIMIEASQ